MVVYRAADMPLKMQGLYPVCMHPACELVRMSDDVDKHIHLAGRVHWAGDAESPTLREGMRSSERHWPRRVSDCYDLQVVAVDSMSSALFMERSGMQLRHESVNLSIAQISVTSMLAGNEQVLKVPH